jgi:hypothetical protein
MIKVISWADEFEGEPQLTAPDNKPVLVRVDEREGYTPENSMIISCAALRALLDMPNEHRMTLLRDCKGAA